MGRPLLEETVAAALAPRHVPLYGRDVGAPIGHGRLGLSEKSDPTD